MILRSKYKPITDDSINPALCFCFLPLDGQMGEWDYSEASTSVAWCSMVQHGAARDFLYIDHSPLFPATNCVGGERSLNLQLRL